LRSGAIEVADRPSYHDLDNLDPAFRVALNNVPNGGVSIGAPVVGTHA